MSPKWRIRLVVGLLVAVTAAALYFPALRRQVNKAKQLTEKTAEQARRCLENLEAVCAAAGTKLASAVRVTVYMTDLSHFGEVNEVYASYFDDQPPARVTVGVAALPRGAYVEIDAIVALGARSDG